MLKFILLMLVACTGPIGKNYDISVVELKNDQNQYDQLIQNFNYKTLSELSEVMWQKKVCHGHINQPVITKLENEKALLHYFEGQVNDSKAPTKCVMNARYSYIIMFVKLKNQNKIEIVKSYAPIHDGPLAKEYLLKKYYE